MKLIVGLGNPGNQYENTRHNVGFMALDYFAQRNNIDFKLKTEFKGFVGTTNIGMEKAIFLKPVTYMNLSGESVRAVMNFYKINVEDIIVILDDLSLPVGKVRVRGEGSSGGHNGLKSINNHLSTENYKRIKIGIDRSEVIPVVDYVLGKFSNDDKPLIQAALEKTELIINDFIKNIEFKTIISTRN